MTQTRFLSNKFLELFANGGEHLRLLSDGVARRILALLGGLDPGSVPDPPTDLVATAGDNSVTLTWTAAAGASGYDIERGLSATGPFVPIGSTTGVTFVAVGLTLGTIYWFRVRARTVGGLASGWSPAVPRTPGANPTPAAPPSPTTPTAGAPTGGSITVGWDALTGTAVATNVYISSITTGPYVRAATAVAGVSYVVTGLAPGRPYYFVFTHINNLGVESAQSTEVTATTVAPDVTAPPIPVGVAAVGGDAQVRLGWGPVVAPDLDFYQVHRSLSSGSGFSQIGTTVIPSYVDGGRTNGTPYYYHIKSVDTTGNVSAASAEVTATPAAIVVTVPPSAPTGVTATTLPVSEEYPDGGITVTWSANPESDIASYRIFQGETAGGKFVLVSTISNGTLVANFDYGAAINTTRFFFIRAVNTSGLESGDSARVSASPLAPPGSPGNEPVDPPLPSGTLTGVQLGTTHRTTASFAYRYVIDLRGYTGSTPATKIAANELTAKIASGDIVLPTSGANIDIAVLMPDRVETEVVGFGPSYLTANAVLPVGRYNLHVIGSYPDSLAADIEDVYDDIFDGTLARTDFGYRIEPTDGGGVLVGGDASLGIFPTENGFTGEIHFWFVGIRGSAKNAIQGYHDESPAPVHSALFFHGIRIDQVGWVPPLRSVGGGRTMRDFSNWGVSSFYFKVNFEGMYVDMPWAIEHAFYIRQCEYGNMTWRKMRIKKCGGQAFQITFRDSDGPRTSSHPMGGTPGTLTIQDVEADEFSRADVRATAGITVYGMHHFVDMSDCRFLDTTIADRFRVDAENIWPPWNGTTFAGPTLSSTVGGFTQTNTNKNDYVMEDGHVSAGVRMRGVTFFSVVPDKSIGLFAAARSVDIEDSDFICGSTGQNAIIVGYQLQGGNSVYQFDDFNWTGNNNAGRIAALETELSLSGFRTPSMFFGLAGGTQLNPGDASGTYAFTNWLRTSPTPTL